MAAPSPIHRDPEVDGDNYGCVGRNAGKANSEVAKLVTQTQRGLKAGEIVDDAELISYVHAGLRRIDRQYDCGSFDTVVIENVFAALRDSYVKAGIEEIDPADAYGW